MPDFLDDLLDSLRPTVRHPVGARRMRNYVDLHAGRLRVAPNHPGGTVEFSFPVKNSGDLPAKGPFSIVVGVSYQLHNGAENTIPQSYTHEAVYTFSVDSEISGNSTYMTPPLTAFLGYIDISSVNKYTVEIIIDSEMQVAELSESNNRSRVTWFTSTPNLATRRPGAQDTLLEPSVSVLSRHTKDAEEINRVELMQMLDDAKGLTIS